MGGEKAVRKRKEEKQEEKQQPLQYLTPGKKADDKTRMT